MTLPTHRLPKYPYEGGTLPFKGIYTGSEALTGLRVLRIPERMIEATVNAGERFISSRLPHHSLDRGVGIGRQDARIAEMSFEASQTSRLWLPHDGNITYLNGKPRYFPKVRRYDGLVALTACQGNEHTGDPRNTPDRLSPMGRQMKDLIDSNRHVMNLAPTQSCFGEIVRELAVPHLHILTYILLIVGEVDSTRLEVSLPIEYDTEAKRITDWHTRMIPSFPQLSGQPTPRVIPDSDPGTDPVVIRRATGEAV